MHGAGLLCRDDAERARVVDVSRQLQPRSSGAIALLFVAALLGVPSFGWWPPVTLAASAALFRGLQARLDRFRRPELALLASWIVAQAAVALVILVASGPRQYLLPLFAFPMMLASVVWPTRTVVAGALLSSVLLVVVAVVAVGDMVTSTPPLLAHQVALLLSTAIVGSIVRDVERASRRAAIVDQLTGALNRAALRTRALELEQSAAHGLARTGVLVLDVDRFKAINDRHGHAMGDAVLCGVADRLRAELPAFAGVYRYGGEEFVVLLPDSEPAAVLAVAERLRMAVADRPIAGVDVTVSVGGATTRPGESFDFATLFGRADAALYEAKRDGRDRVRLDDEGDAVTVLRANRVERRRAPEPARAGAAPERHAALRDQAASWLVDANERRHLVELAGRLREANPVPYALAFAATLFLGPWFGWWPIVPVVVGSLLYRRLGANLGRRRRPEYWLGGAWLLAQAGNALAFLVADVPEGVTGMAWALPMLTLMMVGSSAVFPGRATVLGVAYTAALMAFVIVMTEPATITGHPSDLVFVFALLACFAVIGSAVGRSAVDHRGAAIVDPLTGLLNRRALEARSVELAHQSALTGAGVAVVVGDLDHFKAVNDRLGHAAGDAVLRGVADRMRSQLRAFEDLYRFGGEELVVVLAGVDAATAAEVAERLRRIVGGRPIGGVEVTLSLGVAATAPGEPFDFDAVRARADLALYEAKAAGRDRVRVAGAAAPPVAQAAA